MLESINYCKIDEANFMQVTLKGATSEPGMFFNISSYYSINVVYI